MDESRPEYRLKAPGPAEPGSPRRLPGRSWPDLDDHLVQPEVTRDEIIGGRKVVAFPAEWPHATQQVRLDLIVETHVASGFEVAADLLTRHAVDSDFASDTCVSKAGVDPQTGRRYLEELAFEIVAEQSQSVVTEKAVKMQARGVRRIFALFLKKQRVAEWSPESQSWRTLKPSSQIEDPCLVKPIAVKALLDAAAAQRAAFEGMIAQGGPAVREWEAATWGAGKAEGWMEGKDEGKAEGKVEGAVEATAAAVLKVLKARGLAVSAAERTRILRCRDLDRLDRWLGRAALAASTAEVVGKS